MASYDKYAKARDAAGMNDRQVAKALGFSASTLYEWKAGQYEPKLGKLQAIAGLFNIPLADLLEG